MTKKAAAQLGVPIVIIDREYFAERETDKIDVMKKLITDEKKECLDSLKNISQKELSEAESDKIAEYYQHLFDQTSEKSAIIELNTRQAIETGYLREADFDINKDFLQLYFDKHTTYDETAYAADTVKKLLRSEQKKHSDEIIQNN